MSNKINSTTTLWTVVLPFNGGTETIVATGKTKAEAADNAWTYLRATSGVAGLSGIPTSITEAKPVVGSTLRPLNGLTARWHGETVGVDA